MEYEHGKLSNYQQSSEGLSSTLVEHLSQQLESYKCELSSKREQLAVLHTELADKEELIKDQLDTINEYREEMVRLGDCPVLQNKRKMRRARGAKGRRGRPARRSRPRLEAATRERSVESESLSEPEAGVSLARIGLPLSFPDNPEQCSCDRNNLLSDSDDKQSKSGDVSLHINIQIFFSNIFFQILVFMFQGQNNACLLLLILFCLLFLIFSDKKFYSLAFPPDNPETSENSHIGIGTIRKS